MAGIKVGAISETPLYIYIYIYIYRERERDYRAIGLMSRVFANSPGDQGSIPGRVIAKTQKMVLGAALLNIQHYKARARVKWGNPGNGVAPSPTPLCSSY